MYLCLGVGNDENNGLSKDKPFKSLSRAMKEVREPSKPKSILEMYLIQLEGRIELTAAYLDLRNQAV